MIVLGDMNDSAEFDIYAAELGGSFLASVMGSVWQPERVFHHPHASMNEVDRWTIDFKDRVVNPLTEAPYGMPIEMRSWIDHILISPELKKQVDLVTR